MLDTIPLSAELGEVRDRVRLYRWSHFNNPLLWAAANGDEGDAIIKLRWVRNVLDAFGTALHGVEGELTGQHVVDAFRSLQEVLHTSGIQDKS
eukprot:376470-Pyramimonas_sp.AAC.1